ncbi:MAG: TraR/DksA C4-type zinc finger protein [Sedimentisphaerales bacterium]|nr:TraR/DksA C4-type zinc finger protein [Sedimentisphaerales bacterium]
MAKERKKAPEKKAVKEPEKKATKVKSSPDNTAYLTATEIAHFRQLLLEKRSEIIGDVNSMENEALKKSRLDAAGDLSSMPIHMADIGTDNYEQEFALGLLDSERKLLHEINDALIRIEDSTYGICEGTGEPIPKARLEASPWARYCVAYARQLELGLIPLDDEEQELEDKKKSRASKKRKKKSDEDIDDEIGDEEDEPEEREEDMGDEEEDEDEIEEIAAPESEEEESPEENSWA